MRVCRRFVAMWAWISGASSLCTWTIAPGDFEQECTIHQSLDACVTELKVFGLSTLEAGDFDRFVNLQRLFLDVTSLNELPEVAFENLSNLKHLNLRGSTLESLSDKVFDKLINLEVLSLGNTNISSLPEKVFERLVKLKRLSLHNNHLTGLREGVFNKLINLEELDLKNNQLAELPPQVFDQLTNLTHLFLNDNNLHSLPEALDILTEEQRFCLELNGEMPQLAITCAEKLAEINFTDLRGIFGKLTKLEELDLQNNQLAELSEQVFDHLQNVTRLFLNDNSLRDLPEGVFDMLTNLEQLHLFRNHLGDLQREDFSMLANLKELYVRNACVRPTITTGYDFTNVTEVLTIENFNVSGITCATGYSGVASTGNCNRAPNEYTLEGCWPLCVDPANVTGYNLTGVHKKILVARSFNVPGVTCATGYFGYARAVKCHFAGDEYTFEGCEPVVDGGWGVWLGCSTSCGDSVQFRRCENPRPQNGGKDCDGARRRICNTKECPVDGYWSVWTTCSSTCGGGIHTRLCHLPRYGGNNCTGADVQGCNAEPCPIHGNWAEWTSCTVACGSGERTRWCNNPPPQHGGESCGGCSKQQCNRHECVIPLWGEWGPCSPQCSRTRECLTANCVGHSVEECNSICVVHGGWSVWGACESPCGYGERRRVCNNPYPANGGSRCLGPASAPCGYSCESEFGIGVCTCYWKGQGRKAENHSPRARKTNTDCICRDWLSQTVGNVANRHGAHKIESIANRATDTATNVAKTAYTELIDAGGNIVDWTEGAAGSVADWTEGAAGSVADWTEGAAGSAADWTEGAAGSVADTVSGWFGR